MKEKKILLNKLVCIFVAVSILILGLSSCGRNEEKISSEDSSIVSSSSQSEEPKSETGVFDGFKTVPADFDLGGATVLVTGWGGEAAKIQLGETGDIQKLERRREIAEEKYNFKFEFKEYSGQAYADMFAASSAAGIYFADIVRASSTWAFPTWLNNGFYAPICDIIDFEHEKYSPQADLTNWIDGKHYYLTIPTIEPMLLLYNPELLERAGAPDPLTLSQEGKWDWDAMFEIAKLTTKDVGTQNEQYGFRGWFVSVLLLSNGVAGVRVGDGELTSGLFDNAALNALNFYRKLYVEEKAVDPADWTIGAQNFINGTNAMLIGERWQYAQLRKDMTNFKVVPMPFGPDNEERLIISNNIGVTGFSPLSEVPLEELLALWIYGNATDYKPDAETFIDPFENFYKANEDSEFPIFDSSESIEHFWDVMINAKYALGPSLDGQLMWDYIVGGSSPISLGENPSTVLATMENEVRAYLESLLQ